MPNGFLLKSHCSKKISTVDYSENTLAFGAFGRFVQGMQQTVLRYPRLIPFLIPCFTAFAPIHSEGEPPPSTATPPINAAGIPVTTVPYGATARAFENSVVKIVSTLRYPDVYKPWMKQAPTEVTGSGIVIEGKRILTSAQLVNYASQVQVQTKPGSGIISANIEAIAPGIGLALLKLDDESLFDDHAPVPRSKGMPNIKDSVIVYGYPTGQADAAKSKGTISQIDFTTYHSSVSGLRIQIDGTVNAGNSGGLAVVNDAMIGLVFNRQIESKSTAYVTPCEEIGLFLEGVAGGLYDRKPALFDEFQPLVNPALRSFLKLDKSIHGIVVHEPGSNEAAYPLKQWDVITKIGSNSVDDQGMITIEHNLQVRFTFLVQKLAKDGKVPLTVIRDGKELQIEVTVFTKREMLLPSLDGTYPSYFVYGPLVFSNATSEFVGGITRGSKAANLMSNLAFSGSPLLSRAGDKPAFDRERLVVVSSHFFSHKLSVGYANPSPQVVKSISGVPVRNLNHLVEILRDSKDEFVTIEFSGRGLQTLVFPRSEMSAATEEVLSDNGVHSQGSPDALAIWKAGSP